MLIIQQEPLINTLINGLKTFAASSLPACIKIVSIFERMSFFQNFIDSLGKFKIGSMVLSLLHAQVALKNLADRNMAKDKMAAYLKSQNQLLKLVVSLLFNLSENPSTMRKMVNKDIVTALVAVLDRRNADLLILSLRFLRKIAIVPVNWSDIPYDQICIAIIQNIFRWGDIRSAEGRSKRITVLREAVELLYAFAFHFDAIETLKGSGVFEGIGKLVDIPELRSQLIRMFYKCSVADGNDEAFRNENILNLLITASTTECEERMISLVVLSKLSLDRECSATIAKSPIFTADNLRNMFIHATGAQTGENKVLLKLIRNIADSQPELIKGFDAEIVAACARNSGKPDTLVDIVALANRAKINSDRAKFFVSQPGFVQLIVGILGDPNAIPQLQLESIMFVSSLVLYSATAQVLRKMKIVDVLVAVFTNLPDELDIQTQCLFAFYRLISHSDTRAELLKHQEIVEAVIRHSRSHNGILNGIANSVLDAMVTFDKSSAERLKGPRFDAFNHEWLQGLNGKV
jgi:hypothetical protein